LLEYRASLAFPQSSFLKAHQEIEYHLPATLLFWLSLTASLTECLKGLLDSGDQRSQIAQREFREVTVCMDHAESLPLDDLPSLVLCEATALPGFPRNQGFPPRVGKFGLRVVN
jgi:hypothetical protein